jgi:hypothetical protein
MWAMKPMDNQPLAAEDRMEVPAAHSPNRNVRSSRLESGVAVFIALMSLAITLYEAQATREHDRMSVWPRLSQESSDSAGMYDRAITNVGLGPALVRAYEVRVDGAPRTSWERVVAELVPALNPKPGFFFSHIGAGTVLLPGHTIHVLTTVTGREFSAMAIAQDHRIVGRLCYCSLYGECWLAESNKPDPAPVRTCAGAADTTSVGR